MTRYLSPEEILVLHRVLIQRYGGEEGIRDWGLIESAVNRPRSEYAGQEAYPELEMKASVLFFSLVNNHGFIDGNKRAGIAACSIFLELNGYRLEATNEEVVKITLRIATSKLDEQKLAGWIKAHLESSEKS